MRESTLPVRALCLFIGLNVADLLLTWRLLGDGHSLFYESNPIARWWLRQGGWVGLIAFKGMVVALVLGIFLALLQQRPETGQRLLCFASSLLIVVVLYSTSLASCQPTADNALDATTLQAITDQKQHLEEEVQAGREYTQELRHLSGELAAQRCTLEEAVDRLSTCRKAQSVSWREYLREHFRVASDRAGLAANLVQYTVASWTGEPGTLAAIGQRLRGEFRAVYGVSLLDTQASVWPQ
jgi:hypothetical protein